MHELIPGKARPHLAMLCIVAVGVLLNAIRSDASEPIVRSLQEIRQHNVVIQEWDLSCGAAALATLLKFQHGDPVSEREIAVAMMGRAEYLANPAIVTYRQGFSLLDLKRFVDERGYNGVGLGRLTIDDLEEFAPIIVPLELHGYPHFVVFRGIQGGRIHVADPSFGNRTMSVPQFQKAWIDMPGLGHIGFRVLRTDGLIPPDRLALSSNDGSSIGDPE